MLFLGQGLLQICISCSPNSHIYLYSDTEHLILKISKFYFKFHAFKVKLVKTLIFDIYVTSDHFMSVSIFLRFSYFHVGYYACVSIHVNVGAHTYVCTCMFMEAR